MEKIIENYGKKNIANSMKKNKKNKKFLEKGGVNQMPANRGHPTPILQELVFIKR